MVLKGIDFTTANSVFPFSRGRTTKWKDGAQQGVDRVAGTPKKTIQLVVSFKLIPGFIPTFLAEHQQAFWMVLKGNHKKAQLMFGFPYCGSILQHERKPWEGNHHVWYLRWGIIILLGFLGVAGFHPSGWMSYSETKLGQYLCQPSAASRNWCLWFLARAPPVSTKQEGVLGVFPGSTQWGFIAPPSFT